MLGMAAVSMASVMIPHACVGDKSSYESDNDEQNPCQSADCRCQRSGDEDISVVRLELIMIGKWSLS